MKSMDEVTLGASGILTELAAERRDTEVIMIDATHLKDHRTAASLRGKKGAQGGSSGAQKAV